MIRKGADVFSGSLPMQFRNQARVHLWFPKKFGFSYPKIFRTTDSIALFADRAHCVGVRLSDHLEICAPCGLQDLFDLHLTPNFALPNAATYMEKTERQKKFWPELSITAWPKAIE